MYEPCTSYTKALDLGKKSEFVVS